MGGNMKRSINILAILSLVSSLSVSAFGGAEEDYNLALELFTERADQNKTSELISLLEGTVESATDKTLKYNMYTLLSHAYQWKATGIAGSAKKAAFEKGMDRAKKAIKISDSYADAHYWYGLNLLLYVKELGDEYYLLYFNELKSSFNAALDRDTVDDNLGEELDGYGPNRLLGTVYYRLPEAIGGSVKTGLSHLEVAVEEAPDFVVNHLLYWDAYSKQGSSQKKEACTLIEKFLDMKPTEFNLDRVPETKVELYKGCVEYRNMCNKPAKVCTKP